MTNSNSSIFATVKQKVKNLITRRHFWNFTFCNKISEQKLLYYSVLGLNFMISTRRH